MKERCFRLFYSSEFLEQLCLKMHEKIYGPEEIIYDINSNVNNIYFLRSGKVEMF